MGMPRFLTRENSAALAYLVAGAWWFALGTTYGLFSAIHLMAPELIDNIPFLTFSRIRPAHVNTVLFGFVGSTLTGVALYYVPQLFKRRLWSEPLAWLSWLLWNVAIASGSFTFTFGFSQGREYAEYLFSFDICFLGSLILLLINAFMSALRRREKTLYVSVWYVFGSLMAMIPTYFIGNAMMFPETGAYAGLFDSVALWFYAHNLVGLLLTPLAVGAAYYIIPRVVRAPLYSHTLSLAGFWTLVAIYTPIGGHHILQTPIPNWLKIVSVANSIGMFVPVFIALANLWLTARGRVGRLWRDVGGRAVFLGTIWYLITCIQGPLQSLPEVQKYTHLNNWNVGHAHIAVLGFSGFIALGALWYVLPLITGRRVYSTGLVSLQLGLVTIGLTGFFFVLTIAGLIQGTAWYKGEVVYRVVPWLRPYMGLRAMFGVFIILGSYIGLINLLLSLFSPKLHEQGAEKVAIAADPEEVAP